MLSRRAFLLSTASATLVARSSVNLRPAHAGVAAGIAVAFSVASKISSFMASRKNPHGTIMRANRIILQSIHEQLQDITSSMQSVVLAIDGLHRKVMKLEITRVEDYYDRIIDANWIDFNIHRANYLENKDSPSQFRPYLRELYRIHTNLNEASLELSAFSGDNNYAGILPICLAIEYHAACALELSQYEAVDTPYYTPFSLFYEKLKFYSNFFEKALDGKPGSVPDITERLRKNLDTYSVRKHDIHDTGRLAIASSDLGQHSYWSHLVTTRDRIRAACGKRPICRDSTPVGCDDPGFDDEEAEYDRCADSTQYSTYEYCKVLETREDSGILQRSVDFSTSLSGPDENGGKATNFAPSNHYLFVDVGVITPSTLPSYSKDHLKDHWRTNIDQFNIAYAEYQAAEKIEEAVRITHERIKCMLETYKNLGSGCSA